MNRLHLPSLLSLPRTVLEDIALYVVVATPLGPPSQLLALLLTSRTLNAALRLPSCPNLYARIFKLKFDTSAARRRLGAKACYTSSLASQLVVYSRTLQRVRRYASMTSEEQDAVDAAEMQETLWAAFFVMLEHDSNNATQLLRWANLKGFIEPFARRRVWQTTVDGWPSDQSPISGLALWLWYFSTTPADVEAETEAQRRDVMDIVRPFVVNPRKYPPFQASDAFFTAPSTASCPSTPRSGTPAAAEGPARPQTPTRQYSPLHSLTHYAVSITLAAPPPALPARLIYLARSEATPIRAPDFWPRDRDEIPPDQQWVRPTRRDLEEFNVVRAAAPLKWGEESEAEKDGDRPEEPEKPQSVGDRDEQEQSPMSTRFDHDWARWRYCHTTNGKPVRPPSFKRTPYTPGTLSGTFCGRSLVPDIQQYRDMHAKPQYTPGVPTMSIVPLSFTLKEYLSTPHAPSLPRRSGTSELLEEDNTEIDKDYEEPQDGAANDPHLVDHGRTAWFPPFRWRCETTRMGFVGPPPTFAKGRELDLQIPGREDERTYRYEAVEMEEGVRTGPCAKRDAVDASDEEKERKPCRCSPGSGSGSRSRSSSPSALPSQLQEVDLEENLAAVRKALPGVDVENVLERAMREAEKEQAAWVRRDAETVYDQCDGVGDVIVSGQTCTKHALAWHRFTFWGRIRPWDGLCAIISTPQPGPLAAQVFRGYVVGGKYLVGSWRLLAMVGMGVGAEDRSVLEGPFVATRVGA